MRLSTGGSLARATALSVSVAVMLLLAVVTAPSARAECPPAYWDPVTQQMVYCQEQGGDEGTPGGPGGPGGSTAPTCTLTGPYTFCNGTQPCYTQTLIVPYAGPQTPAPFPGAPWHHQACQGAGGDLEVIAVWDAEAPEPPSLQELAQQALGNLQLPTGQMETNPARRSFVHLPTWFGVDGMATQGTGTAAFGLVAIATPDHLEVTTGDGGRLRCDVDRANPACAHAYRRASVGQPRDSTGLPGYPASAVVVWDVRFEQNGVVVVIPAVPTEVTSEPMQRSVPVAEIQTVVGSLRS